MGIDSVNTRVLWSGTVAALANKPGWTRDDACDGRFLQGDDETYTGPSNAGGSHTHTNSSHTHVGISHTHTFSGALAAPSSGVDIQQSASGLNDVVARTPPGGVHDHRSATSVSSTITYSSTSLTIASVDADVSAPQYMQMIVIKPNDQWQDIPDDANCYTDETTAPTGFANDLFLSGLYVRGADAAGDGGGTGGFVEHDHGTPADHDHDPALHLHLLSQVGTPSRAYQLQSNTGGTQTPVETLRHHDVTLMNKALADVSSDSAGATAASSNDPDYIKLRGIKNTSGVAATPVGVIAAFVGDVTAAPDSGGIPPNWIICDGDGGLTEDCTDRQILSTTVNGDIGKTDVDDGVDTINSHTNAIAGTHNHTHTGPHDHTPNQSERPGHLRTVASPTNGVVGAAHNHSWLVGTSIPQMLSASVTVDTADGRTAYRTVVWIKKISASPTAPRALSTW